jgi:hypothetical protein
MFAQRFFRIVGVAVMAIALINFANAYNLLGIERLFERAIPSQVVSSQQTGQTPPSSSSVATPQPTTAPLKSEPKEVVLNTVFRLDSDITPHNFTTKVGKKTTMIVDVKEDGEGCMSTIMIPGLDDNPQFLKGGKKIDRKSTRLNSSHNSESRMPSSA